MDELDSDQAAIMAKLEPFLPRVFPLFSSAMRMYVEGYPPNIRAEHDDRAAMSAVYCHIWKGFQREFVDEPGFTFLNVRGLELLNIYDEIVIRAKKVDANGRHRNSDTEQQRNFDAQIDLPGLPPEADRLVVGYQPDIAFTEVERVLIRRPKGDWISQILEPSADDSWVDITPARLPFAQVKVASRK